MAQPIRLSDGCVARRAQEEVLGVVWQSAREPTARHGFLAGPIDADILRAAPPRAGRSGARRPHELLPQRRLVMRRWLPVALAGGFVASACSESRTPTQPSSTGLEVADAPSTMHSIPAQ